MPGFGSGHHDFYYTRYGLYNDLMTEDHAPSDPSDRFAPRTDWPQGSNRISELAESLRCGGIPWIDLTDSNPTRCGLDAHHAGWLTALTDPANLRYEPDPKGLLKARQAVAAYYAAKGVRVDPEQVLLTSGTSEAYHLVLRLLTQPGQAVLTPTPSYPLIDLLLDLNDIRQDRYPLTCSGDQGDGDASRNGWTFDASAARLNRRPGTPALIAIHANNPTGHTFSLQERGSLVEFARTEKMALVVDEVFLDYSSRPSETFAGEDRVLTFTLSGISKLLGLPQMKLSWIVVSGPRAELDEAVRRLEIMADIFLSVNAPAQNALASWMSGLTGVQDLIRERVRVNQNALKRLLPASSGIRPLPCAGAWTAVLDLPPGTDGEIFAYELLRAGGVLTHPGYLFDLDPASRLVLSLLPPPDLFAEGVRRIVSK